MNLTSINTASHYRLIKPLGEGTYAKAALAIHPEHPTPIVIKQYHPWVIKSYDARNTIHTAYEIRQRFKHIDQNYLC